LLKNIIIIIELLIFLNIKDIHFINKKKEIFPQNITKNNVNKKYNSHILIPANLNIIFKKYLIIEKLSK